MDLKKLSDKFEQGELEWRIGQSGVNEYGGKQKIWASLLCYVTNRAIMNRLDEVCQPHQWKNEFKEWPDGQLCGISIKVGDEWITKWDGAQCTAIEKVKGGLSDAMKRAAVQWGIGRYLYELPATFVEGTEAKPSNTDGWHKAYVQASAQGKKIGFWWQEPQLAKIAPWALPVARKVELPPQMTMDEVAALALAIEECTSYDTLRSVVGLQLMPAAEQSRFPKPIQAMELAKSAASHGGNIVTKKGMPSFQAMLNHFERASLISSEESKVYSSLARSRLEMPQE